MGGDKTRHLRGKGQVGPSLTEVTCHSLDVEKRCLSMSLEKRGKGNHRRWMACVEGKGGLPEAVTMEVVKKAGGGGEGFLSPGKPGKIIQRLGVRLLHALAPRLPSHLTSPGYTHP